MPVIVFGSAGVDRFIRVPGLAHIFDRLPAGDNQRLFYFEQEFGKIHSQLLDGVLPEKLRAISDGAISASSWLPFFDALNVDHMAFGGKGSNAAFAAAKAGVETHFFGALGDRNDPDSNAVRAYLEEAGVEVRALSVPAITCSQVRVFKDEMGRQISLIYRGANQYALGDSVDSSVLGRGSVLVLQTSVPYLESLRLARRAKGDGTYIIFNPTKADNVESEIFSYVNDVVVNRDEAYNLACKMCHVQRGANISDEDLVLLLARQLKITCVMTRGGDSVLVAHKDARRVNEVSTLAITMLDPTGAGDAFLGWYAASRQQGDGVMHAIRKAVTVGAETAAYFGATRPDLCPARANELGKRVPAFPAGTLAAMQVSHAMLPKAEPV